MKKLTLIAISFVALCFTGCTTYQYSARQINVNPRHIDSNEQMVAVVVNYSKQVSATSSYQASRKDAIAEAEFLCIQNAKCDVVVDPILKIEYNPWKIKKRFKATIVGFTGTYETRPTLLDQSKNYTLEEIEKFKLLYDPSFPKYYYNHSAEGDTYYFNTEKKDEAKITWNWFKPSRRDKKNKSK